MKIIAKIKTDFSEKFGIPRQSGLIDELKATVVFEPKYRNPDALRGLEGYSHIWLIWQFSKAVREDWSSTVRPPRLGGNTKMGVFATRSPFRPNPIGLSCVRLDGIEQTEKYGTVLHVRGADLLDGTPIYDIKPYLAFADSRPEAVCGLSEAVEDYALEVDFPEELLKILPLDKRTAAIAVLQNDPRPSYKADGDRVYGLAFSGYNIEFVVADNRLYVTAVTKIN